MQKNETVRAIFCLIIANALVISAFAIPLFLASCLSQENFDKIHNCPKCECPECERCQEPDYSDE